MYVVDSPKSGDGYDHLKIFEDVSVNDLDDDEDPTIFKDRSLMVLDNCLQVSPMFEDVPKHLQDMMQRFENNCTQIFQEMNRQVFIYT